MVEICFNREWGKIIRSQAKLPGAGCGFHLLLKIGHHTLNVPSSVDHWVGSGTSAEQGHVVLVLLRKLLTGSGCIVFEGADSNLSPRDTCSQVPALREDFQLWQIQHTQSWIEHFLAPGTGSICQVPVAVQIQGRLDVAGMQTGWDKKTNGSGGSTMTSPAVSGNISQMEEVISCFYAHLAGTSPAASCRPDRAASTGVEVTSLLWVATAIFSQHRLSHWSRPPWLCPGLSWWTTNWAMPEKN